VSSKSMKVLLRENVDDLGKIGDLVRVSSGYARNHLLPRKLAIEATPQNIEVMAKRRARQDAEEAARFKEFEAQVARLAGVSVTIAERADESGNLYGSVGAAAIARLLADAGHAVEDRQVRLDQPLKTVGEHSVTVRVHGEHEATITVAVTAAQS
jgi:large subunit ribosomal protein L9